MRQNLPLVSSPSYRPASPSFRPVSPTPPGAGGVLEELILVHTPEHLNRSDTIENQDVFLAPFPQDVQSPVRQPLPTSTANLRSPDIIRLENIFRAANSTFSMEASARDHMLQTHIRWGSQLVDSFNFETIIQNVKDILSQVNPKEKTTNLGEHIRGPAICPDIYRLLLKKTHNTAATSASQFMEAFRLWEIGRYFAAEISHRRSQYPRGRMSRTSCAMEGIASEIACASSGLNMQVLSEMKETNRPELVRICHLNFCLLSNIL